MRRAEQLLGLAPERGLKVPLPSWTSKSRMATRSKPCHGRAREPLRSASLAKIQFRHAPRSPAPRGAPSEANRAKCPPIAFLIEHCIDRTDQRLYGAQLPRSPSPATVWHPASICTAPKLGTCCRTVPHAKRARGRVPVRSAKSPRAALTRRKAWRIEGRPKRRPRLPNARDALHVRPQAHAQQQRFVGILKSFHDRVYVQGSSLSVIRLRLSQFSSSKDNRVLTRT